MSRQTSCGNCGLRGSMTKIIAHLQVCDSPGANVDRAAEARLEALETLGDAIRAWWEPERPGPPPTAEIAAFVEADKAYDEADAVWEASHASKRASATDG